MNEVYLLTGGNMGDRAKYLSTAEKSIATLCGPISSHSSIFETAAWGNKDQHAFLNQVFCIHTLLSPVILLKTILGIEENMGRKREFRYSPRIIDIDILFYNDAVVNIPGLTIPHPQIPNRRFVLQPMTEIAPDKMHPILNKTMKELLNACPDPLLVHKIFDDL